MNPAPSQHSNVLGLRRCGVKKKLGIEVEDKTVEEAVKKALKALRMPRNKVKIEVLSEEEKGLFGMPGAKPAKVRVTIIPAKENT